jgi:putative nucleotidyltransferase with HDIG domain
LPAFFTQIDTQSYLQLEPEADLSKKTQQLIEAIEVPSQETVLATISEQLSNSELDLPKIGSLIDTDVILSGLILKTANSPKFNRGLKITSTLHALSFVDSDHLRNLVTTKPTKNNSKQSNSEELKKTNQHSLAIARISEKIAMAIPNSNPEEAFLTGLFHDIGVFFMNRLFADYWDQIMPIEKTDPLKVSLTEMQKYGTHHGIVGYLKTSSWKLPETVSLAIYHHHNPVIEQINNLEVKNLVAINGVAHSLLNTFLQQEEEIPQASDNTLSYYQQCQTSLDLSEDTIHSVRNHLTELLTN